MCVALWSTFINACDCIPLILHKQLNYWSLFDFFCGALITILCVKVYTPEREDVQGNSPYHFRPASYQRGLLTSNGQTFCLTGQHLLHPGRTGRNNTALFSPSDEGSSKEEPSSTVEEVESKSFTEPNSEELDEGEWVPSRGWNASLGCIYYYLEASNWFRSNWFPLWWFPGKEATARAPTAQKDQETQAKGKTVG